MKENAEHNEKQHPSIPKVEESLFKQRTLLIFGEVDDKLAKEVTARLLAFNHESQEPIRIILNSPGGHVESGDTIFDMIRFVTAPVNILGTGWVASAGALIYSAVPKEHRFSLPNTRYMLHQPSGGVGGQASDISIEAQEILKMRDRLNKNFSDQTGQPIERIERDTDRNFWMSAEEARDYGLVGKIVSSAKEV